MPNALRIAIHLVDGGTQRFVQERPAAIERLLGTVTPARLFREPTLMIGGSYSATVFPTSAITHVEFQSAALPNWADPHDDLPLHEVAREVFIAAAQPGSDTAQARPRATAPDELATLARLGLRGGERLYVELRAHTAARIEQRQLVTRLFQTPCFHIRREGGAILLNTANLVSLAFFPGPPELPATAWPMHHDPSRRPPGG